MLETPQQILEHHASIDAVRSFIAWRKKFDRSDLTPRVLDDLIIYCRETGQLTWRARPVSMFKSKRSQGIWNSRYAGGPALSSVDSSNGYLTGTALRLKMYAHRAAYMIHYGKPPDGVIDHINNNRADNRLVNLRDVSLTENARNATPSKGRKAIGVHFVPSNGKWQARIRVGPRSWGGGTFETFEEALAARKKLEDRFWR